MDKKYLVPEKHFLAIWWRSIDRVTIFALSILMGLSVVLIATVSPAIAHRIGIYETYFIERHLIYLIASIVIMFIISTFEPKWIRRFAILGLIGSVFFLILVKIYGYETKGARRWINILGFSLQPSEFVKPFFSMTIAWFMSIKFKNNDFPGLELSVIIYLIIAALIATQPDFGMLITLSAVWAVQLFIAGLPLLWIIGVVFLGLIGTALAYILLPHVSARINNFLDPSLGLNYQVSKSLKALQSGGLYGKGPGEGTIKQTLPDSHSDFIFAVAGEELGSIICFLIIFLFAFITIRALYKIKEQQDQFIILGITGIMAQFAIQSLINIGVNLNLLPTKGMTLPFVSYGGSSNLALSIGMGMFLALSKKKADLKYYKIEKY